MNLQKKIAIVIGIMAILGFGWKVGVYIDSRYALAEEMKAEIGQIKEIQKKESQRLDYKILSDQYNVKDERIFIIEERCKKRPCNETEIEVLRVLKTEKDEIKEQLKKLEEK